MKKRKCGNTELELSELGTGCWAFGSGDYWGDQNQNDVNDVVHASVDYGVNYFDTAEAYNDGRSEQSLGEALRGIPRDKVIIGSKVAPSNTYYDELIRHCEMSLQRLNTDYIDIYMIHWPIHLHSIEHFTQDEKIINSPATLSEAIDALLKLRKDGKIRYFGVSNFSNERLNEIRNLGEFPVVNELPYSLLTRAVEWESLPFCKQNGIGVIGYMTLMQGILANIYPSLIDVPVWQRRTRHFNSEGNELCRHGEKGTEEETNKALNDIRVIMNDYDFTMPELAIKWALANDGITCSLVGARNKKELLANVNAVSQPLAGEIVAKLNDVTEQLKIALGNNFDYYESPKNDRTL